MKNLNKQKGFTLIELVVVIVILGILAATAAPKFIDLQGDARASTIQGVKAAIETATTGVHAKSLIAGNDTAPKADGETISLAGEDITIGSGWQLSTAANFENIMDIDIANNSFAVLVDTNTFFVYIDGQTAPSIGDEGTCFVSYTESVDTNIKPVIEIIVTDC